MYYEETESWMLEGYSAGVRAATRCLDVVHSEGIPDQVAFYFSHDIDPEPQHFAAIDDCLRGAASVCGLNRTGFYGGWLGIDHCSQVNTARWFVQTIAWEYGRGVHPAAHLYQYDIYGPTIYGTPCDSVRSMKSSFGSALQGVGAAGGGGGTSTTTTTTTPPPEPTEGPDVLPNAGRYKVWGELYLASRAGHLLEDVTDQVIGGEVAVDLTAEVPMTFTAQVLDPAAIPAFSWVRPYLRLQWWDPATGDDNSLKKPLGHFIVMPPGERHTAAMGQGTIDGRDGCWLLKQAALGGNKTYHVGDNVVDAVVALVTGAGFSRVHIPARANTFTKQRTYEAGTPTLDVVNDLLMRIAYYPLWFDRQGVAMSRKIQPRQKTQMRRTISSANGDVVGVVDIETDPERLCNRATVIVNDPDHPNVFVTKTNNRASSPVSVPNLGFVKAKVIEGSNVDSVAEATDLVNQALEDGASVETRVQLATLPDPGFGFHETVWLDVQRDDGAAVLTGSWWWDQTRIGFTPRQQPQTWRLNKLVPWDDPS